MSYEQTIFNRLRQSGLTEACALGMLGNWKAESGCEPYRLEGDYSPYRTASKLYTSRLQSGTLSRQTFGTDRKGYGLAQWTFCNNANTAGRKFDLYDFWKSRGGNIDDVLMQTDFAIWELHHGYVHVWGQLQGINDIYRATDIICRSYEQPAVNNVGERFQYASTYKHELNLNEWQDPSSDEPGEPLDDLGGGGGIITSPEVYWPLRGISGGSHDPGLCNGMDGEDIKVLQAILNARGYPIAEIDGQFGLELDSAVKRFQRDSGLSPDGIVGPLTWTALWKG